MSLTPRQNQFFDLLKSYIAKHDTPPTLEEMKIWCEKNGWGEIRSLNSVKQYFDALADKNVIRREHKKRGITLIDRHSGEKTESEVTDIVHIPVFENPVACGSPTDLVEETPTDTLECSRRLVRNSEKTYAFRARGDSMNLAGIDSGDFVLVETTNDILDGDIVLATIDGYGTLKRFRQNASCISLLPESTNPEHKPIYIHEDDEFVIGGKVINVLKN